MKIAHGKSICYSLYIIYIQIKWFFNEKPNFSGVFFNFQFQVGVGSAYPIQACYITFYNHTKSSQIKSKAFFLQKARFSNVFKGFSVLRPRYPLTPNIKKYNIKIHHYKAFHIELAQKYVNFPDFQMFFGFKA